VIYSHVIPTDGVFELWSRDVERHVPIWKAYKTNSAQILKLLRVSKQFYREAGSLFCETDEFRFSAINGVLALATFMHIIGQASSFLES
jgi:hypothetical protein